MPQAILNSYSFAMAGIQPTSFPNLVMWYRGDYQAWAGGGPVPDNTQIDFWGEKVSGVANALQGLAGDQPLFQSAELNGQDVIEFQGTGADIRAMSVVDANCPTFTGAGQEDYSIFVAIKFTDVVNYQMIVTKGVPNLVAEVPEFRINPSSKMELVEDANYTLAASTALSAGTWYVVGGVRDEGAALLKHYLNGVLDGSVARGAASATGNSFHIGRRDDGFTLRDAFIAEICIYKHAFSDAEALSLQSYFTARYGI